MRVDDLLLIQPEGLEGRDPGIPTLLTDAEDDSAGRHTRAARRDADPSGRLKGQCGKARARVKDSLNTPFIYINVGNDVRLLHIEVLEAQNTHRVRSVPIGQI